MAPKLKRGDRVLIEISSSEIYEGTINSICSKNVEIYDIFCQTTRAPYDGSMTFYRNEVNNITVVSKSEPNNDTNVPVNGAPFESPNISNMDPDEFRRLQEMTHHSKVAYITAIDKKYIDAISVLKDRESVAVVGLGNRSVRSKPFSLLVLADFKQIFIFDLLHLEELGELRDILESTYICKIVHDGAHLYDCFYHKYGVDMQNVFDTQVVDAMLAEEENKTTGKRDIKESLTHHFNFPSSLLWGAIDDMPDKNWWHRPVTRSDRGKAAQLVVYLPSLRDHLMSQILKKYTDATVSAYTKQRNLSDKELLKFRHI